MRELNLYDLELVYGGKGVWEGRLETVGRVGGSFVGGQIGGQVGGTTGTAVGAIGGPKGMAVGRVVGGGAGMIAGGELGSVVGAASMAKLGKYIDNKLQDGNSYGDGCNY